MTFEDELYGKTPDEMHEQAEFKALSNAVRLYSIKDKDELLRHIDERIGELNDWLLKNNSTGISALQEVSSKIIKKGQLKNWKKICNDFL